MTHDPDLTVGKVLLGMGLVNLDTLQQAVMSQRDHEQDMQLGSILVAMGAITQDDLAIALEVQAELSVGRFMEANLMLLDYQARRISRSVDKQDQMVERALKRVA